MPRNFSYLVFVFGLVATEPLALAQDATTEQARQRYQEAQKQFELGNWEAAIQGYAKAYELRPDPIFLYDMAQAHRRSGSAQKALDLYKNYLIKDPKSPRRAEVAERIRSLQKQLDEEAREGKRGTAATPPTSSPEPVPPLPSLPANANPAAPAAPTEPRAQSTAATGGGGEVASPAAVPTGSPAAGTAEASTAAAPPTAGPSPESGGAAAFTAAAAIPQPAGRDGSRGLRIAGLAVGGAGILALGAGVLFSARTRSLSNSVSNAPKFNSSDAEAGKRAAVLQWIGYGTGALLAATGVVLYWQGRPRKSETVSVSVSPTLGPGAAGAVAVGSF
jgi:hypothetical protein